jgi:hypothetical protein
MTEQYPIEKGIPIPPRGKEGRPATPDESNTAKAKYDAQPSLDALEGAALYDHILPNGVRLGAAKREDLLAAWEWSMNQAGVHSRNATVIHARIKAAAGEETVTNSADGRWPSFPEERVADNSFDYGFDGVVELWEPGTSKD